MRRPLYVSQRENLTGEFWYTVRGGNSRNILTSEMYPTRSNALRAAKAFIRSIDPAPVSFSWWSGPTHPDGLGPVNYHSERIR